MGVTIPGPSGKVKESYEISNSLRFNNNDSPRLTFTPSSAGNRRTFTLSVWFKLSVYSTGERVLLAADDGTGGNNNFDYIAINGNDKIFVYNYEGSQGYNLISTQLLRDPSAWYHLVVAFDTTDGTAGNRIKVYLNGNQVTNFDTEAYPSQNFQTRINNNNAQRISSYPDQDASYFDGYMCEYHLVDGSQLAPTSFGEFDDNGVWIPKRYTGSHGTNGFYLEFKQTGTSQNSSGIGADTSGNDNHWAVTNLAATDVTEDTCTNNFATMNPLAVNASGTATFSEGNCQVATVVSGSMGGYCNIHFPSSGKWYCEAKITTSSPSNAYIGVVGYDASDSNTFTNGDSTFYYGNGQKYVNNSTSSYGTAWSQNDIIGMAVNVDDNEITFYLNGSSQGALSETLEDKTWNCGDTNGSISHTFQWNFGNPVHTISSGNNDGKYGNFEYAPPSGYYALCTKRLAEFG